ncbi:MAG: AAA family ATPase [Tannerella sp.]|jgi:SpoVK/Ycf46/Vps4 family AAA+-type ATPase|nr:AAA family ATPase [Tannerella sp.]
MSRLRRLNDHGFIYIFGKESLFCDDKLCEMSLEQHLAYILTVEEKYDLVLFYDRLGGIRFPSKGMTGIYAQITGLKAPIEERGTNIPKLKRRGILSPVSSGESAKRETQNNNALLVWDRDVLPVFEALLKHPRKTEELENLRVAIVVIGMENWLDKGVENLNSFFSKYGLRQGKDLIILCFNGFTPSEAKNQYEGSRVFGYLTEWVKSLNENSSINPGIYKNIIQIEGPSQAEIRNLLNRKRLTGELMIPASQLDMITEEVYKFSKSKKLSLGSISVQINTYCTNKGLPVTFDKETFMNAFNTKVEKTGRQILSELKGLESIHSELKMIETIVKNDNINKAVHPYRSRFADLSDINNKNRMGHHFALKGNPGTGKTTIANLLGGYLYEIGALSSGHVIPCVPKDLIAGFVGQTALKTTERVQEAIGGVLFIDEISGIVGDSKNDLDARTHGFSKEVNGVLLSAMTSYPDLSVIIAGYPHDVDAFISSDDGFGSRFLHIIELPDYNAEQLAGIFRDMASKEGYKIADELEFILNDFIENWLQLKPFDGKWGNVREIENIVRRIKGTVDRDRIIKIKDIPENIDSGKSHYNLKDCIKNCGKNKPSPLEELECMIGLQEVKTMVKKEMNFIDYAVQKGSDISNSMNFLFLGNPGTGKTTVARLMGKILTGIKALPYSNLVEIRSPKVLIDRISGENRAGKIFNSALGRVLFIDEAYGLLLETGGASVITELTAFSENNAGKLCIILAGYPDEMEQLIKTNSGLASRFTQRINFANYSAEELIEIFASFCKTNNCSYDEEFYHLLQHYTKILSEKSTGKKDFGNGREMRNLFICCLKELANRVGGKYTVDDLFTASDIISCVPDLDAYVNASKPKYELPPVEHLIKTSTDWSKDNYNEQALREALIRISSSTGMGSGFLVTNDGYAVTCNHVINGACNDIKARVRIKDSRGSNHDFEYSCSVVSTDERFDIAVIKLKTKENNLPYTALLPYEKEIKEWQGKDIHLLSYPFGGRFDEPSLFKGSIASYQEMKGVETLLLGIEGKSGSSGGMCIDPQSGYVIGIFRGSYINNSDYNLTEEINYACPVKYLWDIFNKEQDYEKNRN